MICRGCTELHPFLSAYRGLAVTPVRQAAHIASNQLLDVSNNETDTPQEPKVKFSNGWNTLNYFKINFMGVIPHWTKHFL